LKFATVPRLPSSPGYDVTCLRQTTAWQAIRRAKEDGGQKSRVRGQWTDDEFDHAWERRHPCRMSAQEIIEQIKSLPASERAQVAKFVVENDDSWIPESFKEGMADAAAGRFVDMETVLSGVKPPSRAAE